MKNWRMAELRGWWDSHSPLRTTDWRKTFFNGLLVVSRQRTFNHDSQWVTVAYSTKILKTWHIAITRHK